ncbi:oligosaccharide flippase family protein [Geomicrobium sp. JSM 1781026]|uniref:oligosaccharide flippase family protein n=1 Tax=Geomicrobium sp. JSM 1781026 TaxID=3344580 RepID=UPI0035C0BD63
MSITRNRILINIWHLLYGTTTAALLNALALVVLASYLQAHDYGVFSVVLAVAMIAGFFTDVGLSDIVLREGAKKQNEHAKLFVSFVKLRLLFLLISVVAGFLFIHFMYYSEQEIVLTSYYLLLPMIIGVTAQSIASTYFQLYEKMQYISYIKMISASLLVFFMIVGVGLSFPPLVMALLYGCAYVIAGMFGMILFLKHARLKWRYVPFHKGLLHQLWMFAAGGLLFVILPHLGPLVLERSITLVEVGLFAIAYRIPQALQQVPFIVAGAYYPALFKEFANNKDKRHLQLNVVETKLMGVIGMLMAVPFVYFSEPILVNVFGNEWGAAAPALLVLSFMLVFQALNIAIADGLTSSGHQTARTCTQFIAVSIGVFLYYFLSQRYGVIGAAVAGVSIEVICLIGFLWMYRANGLFIAKKVVLPFVVIFVATVVVVHQLSFPGGVGAAITVTIIGMVVFWDRDLRELMLTIVGTNGLRRKEMRGASDVKHKG